MKAYSIVAFGEKMQAREVETPKPMGREVLVKVRAAGVCHSDIHIWEGGYDLGHGRKLSLTDRGVTLPHTLGHETVGEVVAMGPDASGVEIGKTYLVYPWIGCGDCSACKDEAENYCTKSRNIGVHRDGGYAEYVSVPDGRYLLDIGDLDAAALAPFACSGVTAFSAVNKLGARIKRAPIVLIGAGGLGLMALAVLKALDAKGAVIVDVSPEKRAAALAAGALAAIDPAAPDANAQIIASVGGAPEGVIDLVGAPATSQLGFDLIGKGGALVMVGLYGGAATFPLALIAVKGVTIFGNLVGNLEETRQVLALVRSGKLAPIPVTRRPLSEANEALLDLRAGKVFGRTVLCPDLP
jgi:alcohol dehydrogenase, propanol-preferring